MSRFLASGVFDRPLLRGFKDIGKNTEINGASRVALVVKNLPVSAGDVRLVDPWVGKIPWRRAWQPTPVFLLGESHAQRSLVGYSP